jgi:hypothetical protein
MAADAGRGPAVANKAAAPVAPSVVRREIDDLLAVMILVSFARVRLMPCGRGITLSGTASDLSQPFWNLSKVMRPTHYTARDAKGAVSARYRNDLLIGLPPPFHLSSRFAVTIVRRQQPQPQQLSMPANGTLPEEAKAK